LKFSPDFIRNHLSKNKKNPANKKAPQVIDLQGLNFGGGEGIPIEHLTTLFHFIQTLKNSKSNL